MEYVPGISTDAIRGPLARSETRPATPIKLTSFGPFFLDIHGSRVFREDVDLKLRPQAVRALEILLQRVGQYVNYEDLIREAWVGNIVSRHTVATTIGAIRKALNEYASWITYRPRLGYRLEVAGVEDLIRTGWHFWHRRTRESVEKALAYFEEASRESPSDPGTHDGVSSCYMILGTMGMRAPHDVCDPFYKAQKRALEVSGWTSKLRAKHARFLLQFERKFADAESELQLAMNEKLTPVIVYLYRAMLYASVKRFDEALDAVVQARTVDPLWPTLPAIEVLVWFCRRQFDIAAECGKNGVDLHPYFYLGRVHYAQVLEFCGRHEEALIQYRFACLVAPDVLWLKTLEARCLANQARRVEAAELLTEIEQIREREYVDPYYMALLYEALGRRKEAIGEFERILAENSPTAYLLDVDPKMDSLRADHRFPRLRKMLLRIGTEEPEKPALVNPGGYDRSAAPV